MSRTRNATRSHRGYSTRGLRVASVAHVAQTSTKAHRRLSAAANGLPNVDAWRLPSARGSWHAPVSGGLSSSSPGSSSASAAAGRGGGEGGERREGDAGAAPACFCAGAPFMCSSCRCLGPLASPRFLAASGLVPPCSSVRPATLDRRPLLRVILPCWTAKKFTPAIAAFDLRIWSFKCGDSMRSVGREHCWQLCISVHLRACKHHSSLKFVN